MRLVCPNCAAQYDVDDRVIPQGGRDVQCSNCGHTWFQTPAGSAERPQVRALGEAAQPASAPETAPPAPEPPTAASAPATAHSGGRSMGHGLPPVDEDEDWEDDEPIDHLPPTRGTTPSEAGAGTPPRPEPGGEAGRRVMDEAVLSILREEAEREARARRAEAQQAVETQADLGLPPPPAPVPRAETAEAPAEPAPHPKNGGEALPDIEEINSTLTAREDAAAADKEPTRRRSAFGLGFGLMLLLAVLAIALYVLAPRLSEAVPALAEPLAVYVATMDEGRIWLDATIRDLMARTGG